MRHMKLLIILAVWLGLLVSSGNLFSRVTHVNASVNPTSFTGECEKMFEFTGRITSDSPGEVRYKWLRSDNARAPEQTIIFNAPGTQIVTTTWTLGIPGKTYNEWEAIQVLSPNPMTSNKAAFTLKCGSGLVERRKGIKHESFSMGIIKQKDAQKVVAPGGLHIRMDLAAYEIRFEIVQRYSQYNGRVRITGVVKNIGAGAFSAGPNQAKAYLYQMFFGVICAQATNDDIIAQRSIDNLAVGATIELSWESDWHSTSQVEGEFPPRYCLLIRFDPDVYNDANEYNNDGNPNNNKIDRSGADINAMFSN
jgi:hypothetical protein